MNRVNLICIGVRDMERSVRFYRDGLVFQTDETVDNTLPAGTGFGGITLAYNAKSKEEVVEVVEFARRAGTAIVKEPQDVFWGGFHACFSDPDAAIGRSRGGRASHDQDVLIV